MQEGYNKYKSIPEDLDRYLKVLKTVKSRKAEGLEKFCDDCTGYFIYKDTGIRCNSLKGNPKSRIILCVKDDCCYFLKFYVKTNKKDINKKDRGDICRVLTEVKNNNDYSSFRALENSNFKVLL